MIVLKIQNQNIYVVFNPATLVCHISTSTFVDDKGDLALGVAGI